MKFCNIAVKHLINFPYDTSDSLAFVHPHHIFHIEDSIHYACILKNDFRDYQSMLETAHQPEHTILNFQKLILEFDIKKMEPIKIKFNTATGKFLVEDGCHRLSILRHKNLFQDEIPEKYINKL